MTSDISRFLSAIGHGDGHTPIAKSGSPALSMIGARAIRESFANVPPNQCRSWLDADPCSIGESNHFCD